MAVATTDAFIGAVRQQTAPAAAVPVPTIPRGAAPSETSKAVNALEGVFSQTESELSEIGVTRHDLAVMRWAYSLPQYARIIGLLERHRTVSIQTQSWGRLPTSFLLFIVPWAYCLPRTQNLVSSWCTLRTICRELNESRSYRPPRE